MLDEETYRRLLQVCNGNEEEMKRLAIEAIQSRLHAGEETLSEEPPPPSLEDFVKSEKPGSRSYGIRGQGW